MTLPIWMTGMAPQARVICGADNGQGDTGGGGITEQRVSEMINAAMTGRLKRFGEEITGSVKSMLAESLTPLQEQLGALKQPPQGPQKGGEGGQPDPRVVELENQLKAMQAKQKEREEAAARQAKELEEREIASALREGLTKAGVRAELLDGALAVVRQRVKRTAEGHVVVTAQREGYTEDLPLDKALGEWANSDVGKHYLPPKQTGGTGTRPGQPAMPSGPIKPGTPEAKALRRQQALQVLAQATGMGGGSVPIT